MEQPKKPSRDLSDLKARLGLAKPATSEAPAAAPQAQPGASATPQAAPGAVMPPPGAMPPPGYAQPAQPAPAPAPAPDVRRDPFAPAAAPAAQRPQFVDAGPPIEIPEEKKGKSKWLFIGIAVSLIPLVIGWYCGRIYGGRLVYNRTIEDAKRIKEGLEPFIEKNKKIVQAVAKARTRVPRGKAMSYDDELVKELEELMATTDLKKTKALQENLLFKTNYARMDDLVVGKLFTYFNNTMRLQVRTQAFIDNAKAKKDTITKFAKDAGESKNYGMVFASDEGGYYLGKLVQVGPPKCEKEKKKCSANQVEGFPVRVISSRAWSVRPGKAKRINEIVVPIMPDEDWRQVCQGKPGYLAYKQYLMNYSTLMGIAGLLARDQKELIRNLNKQANKKAIFAPL